MCSVHEGRRILEMKQQSLSQKKSLSQLFLIQFEVSVKSLVHKLKLIKIKPF